MSRLIALDTETTGLDPSTEAVFEIACVDVDTDREWVWTIQPPDAVVEAMHPKAAEVNRYHERTSDDGWTWDVALVDAEALACRDIEDVLGQIREVLEGAHIVGAVPDFDTRFLTALYGEHDHMIAPRWHYHLIDVEVLAVGWIMRERAALMRIRHRETLLDVDEQIAALDDLLALPYKSDDLAAHCGVEPPSEDERHTALGDARWVARWYRTLTGEVAS